MKQENDQYSGKLIGVLPSWEPFLPGNTADTTTPTTTTATTDMKTKSTPSSVGLTSDWSLKARTHHRINDIDNEWRTPLPAIRALTGAFDISSIHVVNDRQLTVDRINGIMPLPVHRLWPHGDIQLSDEVANATRAVLGVIIHRIMKQAYSLWRWRSLPYVGYSLLACLSAPLSL
jgi:hypothetical protein